MAILSIKPPSYWLRLAAPALLALALGAKADEFPEYRLKAAFIYNFMLFTDWPSSTGDTLNLCIHGNDPFGKSMEDLQGKLIAGRTLSVQRKEMSASLKNCQAVFISAAAIKVLPQVLAGLRGLPVLTLADSPQAMQQGVMLNMTLLSGRITFEANLQAARSAGLNLSSKLLQLATEVKQ